MSFGEKEKYSQTSLEKLKFKLNKLNDESLHNIFREKIQAAKTLISSHNDFSPTLDPLNLDSLFVLLKHDKTNLNVSFSNTHLHGLSNMILQDIASNMKTKKVGSLLLFPDMTITGHYQIDGCWWENGSRTTHDIDDHGKFMIQIKQWRSSLSARVINVVNNTVKVTQLAVRSHYDSSHINLDSEDYSNQGVKHLKNLTSLINKLIIDKIVNVVDEKLEEVFRKVVVEKFSYEKEDLADILEREMRAQKQKHRKKRQVPCEQGEELDEYVDSLFRFAKRLVRVMEPFQLPNATIDLEEYNLQLFLHSGGATRAYTFERRKPAWVMCTNETISLGLTVQLEEVRVMYKYRVIQDWKLLFDGEMEAQVMGPKVQIQFTQTIPKESEEETDEEDEPVQQRIDRLKVWRPGHIRVIVKGLGNITQALSMIINSILSDTETLDPIIRMIETDGVAAANELLKNISIPFFSII